MYGYCTTYTPFPYQQLFIYCCGHAHTHMMEEEFQILNKIKIFYEAVEGVLFSGSEYTLERFIISILKKHECITVIAFLNFMQSDLKDMMPVLQALERLHMITSLDLMKEDGILYIDYIQFFNHHSYAMTRIHNDLSASIDKCNNESEKQRLECETCDIEYDPLDLMSTTFADEPRCTKCQGELNCITIGSYQERQQSLEAFRNFNTQALPLSRLLREIKTLIEGSTITNFSFLVNKKPVNLKAKARQLYVMEKTREDSCSDSDNEGWETIDV